MSHSKKDGRKGGGHRFAHGYSYEWGSRRGPPGWKTPNIFTKRVTHRMERQAAKRQIRKELSDDL